MFRNTKLMTLLAAGLVLFACQKERAEEDILVPGKQLTFTATIDGAGTRTSVDGTKISWNPAEEINIFYGASAGSKFISQNTEPSQSVTFSGTLTAFTGTTEAGEPNSFWAIYPYDESNTSSGSSVTAYLPENQVGVPNNVPDKALMMVAKASGLALSFKQVCARIKVVVSTPGIRKIEIRGNNDETIAGSAVITMNSQGLPEWQDAGTGAGKVIELVPASGTTFEEAEYSIPILPQEFSAGFTMTCYKAVEEGSYSTGAVTFGRNQVRTVNTNKVTEWTSLQPNNVIYYTSSDGAVVTPNNPNMFRVNIVSNEYVDGRGIITFDGDLTTIGYSAFAGNALTSISIPKSVTNIDYYAFYNCSSLTGIVLPEGVKSIGGFAFDYCSGLTGSLVLPEGLTSIGSNAFHNCSGLTGTLVLPEGLTSIGSSAFQGCSGFTGSLVLPNGVTVLGESVFQDCSGFTGSLVLSEGLTSIGPSAFQGCSGFTGSLVLPEGVTSIGNYAFQGCSGFTGSLVLSEGLTSIGYTAFQGCSGFTGSLVLPNGVTSIGDTAFSSCSGFTGLVLPEGLTRIGNYMFNGCSGFTGSLDLPEGLKSIGYLAFGDCSGFTGSLVLPEGVTSIGDSAFQGCSGFTGTLVLPEGLSDIANQVFYKCSGFTGLVLPEGVTGIGRSAFNNCSGLTGSLVLPEGVTSIGSFAFYGCSHLEDIMVLPLTPPTGGSGMFDGTSIVLICVPAVSVDTYKTAQYWRDYADNIRAYPPVPEAVDLGLSVKWASCNLGAASPEQYGEYFAWGEVAGKDDIAAYVQSNYKYYENGAYTKYTVDGKMVLDPEDDAATVCLGDHWRMPSREEYVELFNTSKTSSEWKTVNGVVGWEITSKTNGNSIFIPAGGQIHDSHFDAQGQLAFAWTRDLYLYYSGYAYAICIYDTSAGTYIAPKTYINETGNLWREMGLPIRPVFSETTD